MMKMRTEDQSAALGGEPVAHDRGVHRATSGLECTVQQLAGEEPRPAESHIVHDAGGGTHHDQEQAQSRSQQPRSNHRYGREAVAQLAGDE